MNCTTGPYFAIDLISILLTQIYYAINLIFVFRWHKQMTECALSLIINFYVLSLQSFGRFRIRTTQECPFAHGLMGYIVNKLERAWWGVGVGVPKWTRLNKFMWSHGEPPPTCKQTDTTENITFSQLRAAKIAWLHKTRDYVKILFKGPNLMEKVPTRITRQTTCDGCIFASLSACDWSRDVFNLIYWPRYQTSWPSIECFHAVLTYSLYR